MLRNIPEKRRSNTHCIAAEGWNHYTRCAKTHRTYIYNATRNFCLRSPFPRLPISSSSTAWMRDFADRKTLTLTGRQFCSARSFRACRLSIRELQYLKFFYRWILTELKSKHSGVSWFRWLTVGLSPRRPGLDPRPVNVQFVVDEVAFGPALFQIFSFSPVSFIPPIFHTHV